MIKKQLLLIYSLLLISVGLQARQNQESTPLARYPALSPDGSQIAFSFQGDIWISDKNGEQPRRLTIHEAYESSPVWSPDGSKIAFSSDRFGNDDVFVMNVTGGIPTRLTYHSDVDKPTAWHGDDAILFETRRNFIQIERELEIHKISVNGGTPFRLLDAVGFHPVPSPNGKLIAMVMGSCRVVREAYKGPANRDIWIYNTENKTYTQLTTFEGQDVQADWGDDNTLYFLSASNGKYNIYKQSISSTGKGEGTATAITSFSQDGIRYFDVSADGKSIVFERKDGIYSIPTSGGEAAQINVNISTDYRFDPIEHKTYTKNVSEYAISPNEKYFAIVVRGEIFVGENDKEKKRTVKLASSPYREQDVAWLNDSTLLFTSDKGGQYDIYMVNSSDPEETNIFKSLKHEVKQITNTPDDESYLVVSPDSKKLVFRKGRGILTSANISESGDLSSMVTLQDGWATPSGVTWSPDSKWLAYSLDDLDFNEEVYIHAADGSQQPVNVSMHPKGDGDPFWSADGSKLGFLSSRNNGDTDVWFAWLKKEDYEKTKQDWDEDDGEEEKDKKKDDDEDEVSPIQIDFEDIHYRLEQVTSLPGNESDMVISADGEFFYFVNNRSGRQTFDAKSDLHKIKWDGSELKALTSGGTNPFGVSLGSSGKTIYAIKSGGSFTTFNAESGKQEGRSFTAKTTLNYNEERKQIFDEGWRTLNAGFYDPGFHGQNWDVLRDKYRVWALEASTERDFRDMFNAMLGQINASHMGMYGSDRADTQRERTGLLGVEIVPIAKGIQINRVVPSTPADRTASKLNEGDVITTVNGTPVSATENFYAPFVNTASEKVLLTVNSANGQTREVVIRPATSIRTALYEEWVDDRKELTASYSNGKLGYIHIRGMNWTSFEQFERELTAAGLGKEGIVIDVRYNGGGWTTDYLMAVLNVKQHAYTVPRGAADNLEASHLNFKSHYPFGERLPLASWTKHSIALCNQNSYSNAEIFSHAYKHLGIGKLVGKPTFGAVISTGGKGLIDGSFVRLPFRAWYVHATEKSMENIPAVPDIIVENAPDSKANNVDEQLQKAVDTLLQDMQ